MIHVRTRRGETVAHLARERAFLRAARCGNPRIFGGGELAFAEILKRVAEATRSIEMRAFVWRDDECGNALAEALVAAADRGVQVFIQKDRIAAVYEYLGGNKQSFFHKKVAPTQGFQAWFLATFYQSPGSFRQRPNPLRQALLAHPNITVRHDKKIFDHSKLFVLDEEYLVLGSMGIGDNHHMDWVDVMVEVRGREHIERLRSRLAGRVPFDRERPIDFLVHSRHRHAPRTCPMLEERIALIDRAERKVVIEMAYLGDRRFTAALCRAVRRGVHVLLITSRADVLGNLNLATCNKLLRKARGATNLTICILARIVHSKFVVVDERYVDIGSANFTPLSHGVYDEINLYSSDADFAQRLEEVATVHCGEGQVVSGPVAYGKFASQVERAIMAYQARRGG